MVEKLPNKHMNRYLDRVKGMKAEETYSCRRSALSRFSKWLDSTDQSIEDIGPIEIEDFLIHLSSEGYANTTIATYYDGVRLFFKFLARDGVLEDNPAEDVDRDNIRSITKGTKKENEADIIFVTEEEVEAMVENAPDQDFGIDSFSTFSGRQELESMS